MAWSERPREAPGSAARSGQTRAGLVAAGAESGGVTRPQAPPRPSPAPSRPRSSALGDFGWVSNLSGSPPPLGASACASALRLACVPRRRLQVPSSTHLPFSTLGLKLPVGNASWNRA